MAMLSGSLWTLLFRKRKHLLLRPCLTWQPDIRNLDASTVAMAVQLFRALPSTRKHLVVPANALPSAQTSNFHICVRFETLPAVSVASVVPTLESVSGLIMIALISCARKSAQMVQAAVLTRIAVAWATTMLLQSTSTLRSWAALLQSFLASILLRLRRYRQAPIPAWRHLPLSAPGPSIASIIQDLLRSPRRSLLWQPPLHRVVPPLSPMAATELARVSWPRQRRLPQRPSHQEASPSTAVLHTAMAWATLGLPFGLQPIKTRFVFVAMISAAPSRMASQRSSRLVTSDAAVIQANFVAMTMPAQEVSSTLTQPFQPTQVVPGT